MTYLFLIVATVVSILPCPGMGKAAEIRIVTGPQESIDYQTAINLAQLIGSSTNLGKPTVLPVGSSLDALKLLIEGKAELSLLPADIAYNSWTGRLFFTKGAPLYSILPIGKQALQIVTRLKAERLADLVGAKIAIGSTDRLGEVVARSVLARAGISSETNIVLHPLPRLSELYVKGEIDSAVIFTYVGNPAVARMLKEGQSTLLDIPKDVLASAKERSPFLAEYRIPSGAYRDQKAAFTLTTSQLLISRVDFPADPAFQIIRAYSRNIGSGSVYDFTKLDARYKFTDLASDMGRISAWKPFGYVNVQSIPTGANILANGRYRGLKTNEEFHLTAGDHTISLLKDDHDRHDEKIKVYDQRKITIKTSLTKRPGKRHDVPELEASESLVRSANVPIPVHPAVGQYVTKAGIIK